MAGPVVHTYRAAESGLNVNSYLVEGQSGVVVVDTNLLASDIEALRARLRAAALRLLAGNEKVIAIALDAGFGDVSNFNAAFRKEFGVAPRAYRRLAGSCSSAL